MFQRRSIEDIQRAHDEFHRLATSGALDLCEPDTAGMIRAQLAVLCWVLGHPSGTLFAQNVLSVARLNAAHRSESSCKERVQ